MHIAFKQLYELRNVLPKYCNVDDLYNSFENTTQLGFYSRKRFCTTQQLSSTTVVKNLSRILYYNIFITILSLVVYETFATLA